MWSDSRFRFQNTVSMSILQNGENNMRKVRYRRAVIVVPDAPPLNVRCECCGKQHKISTHHFVYLYTTKEVRANPNLALLNTVHVCFPCHRVANAEKLLQETKPEIRAKLSKLQLEKTGISFG